MNRRRYLQFIGVGSISASVLWESCQTDKQETATAGQEAGFEVIEAGREAHEIERDKRLLSEAFFTEHEMATITVLADIIIPKDEKSGSASEAEVPAFIEFIVKDMPHHQTPMRGGLRWLDLESMNRFEKAFVDCSSAQQLQIVDDIAYPNKVKPGMEQGVAFFNRMRDLTATGFFTTEMGIQDLGYEGNRPVSKWEGAPAEVLEQYGFKDS
ncbi:MAG: gluconate 2-dehydrogenase subunit 3 family protein [Lewinellaceae bacterium]|nr:gluconate 2-dehydrogenase subunit 3 family protein [Saprospiraceae bacterium]MCB9338713.1 gluconate 2-dehydrogenase subunit 3 family protein [Lewinellaceae bacterium]